MIEIITNISNYIKNGIAYSKHIIFKSNNIDDSAIQPIFTLPNIEVMPLKDQNMLSFKGENSGENPVFGTLLKTDIETGETKIKAFSQDSTELSSIYMDKNGDITFKTDNSTVIMKKAGELQLITPHGKNVFAIDGRILFSNGASVSSAGDIISNLGTSLNEHGHQTAFGPTTPAKTLPTSIAPLPSGEVASIDGVTGVNVPDFTIKNDIVSLKKHVHKFVDSGGDSGVTEKAE